MNVLVFELNHEGHRLTYVRALVQALLKLDCQVSFASSAAHLSSDESAIQLSPIRSQIEILPVPTFADRKPLQIAMQRVSTLNHLLKANDFDYVVIPSADGIAQVAGLRAMFGTMPRWHRTPMEIVMHHGGFAYPTTSTVRRCIDWTTRQVLRRGPWKHVHFVDVMVSDWVDRNDPKLARMSSLIPDPVERVKPMSLDAARTMLDLPQKGRIIGCAGALTRRKKIDLLLETFAASDLKQDDRLLLAGRMGDQIQSLIDARYSRLVDENRLIVIDKFLSFEDLHAALSAMDVVALLYGEQQAIASILLRAVAADRSILALRGGWIERMTKTFELGIVCQSNSTEEVARTIGKSLDLSQSYQPAPATDRLLKFHDERNFGSVLTARIAKQLGRKPSCPPLTWEMVVDPPSPS